MIAMQFRSFTISILIIACGFTPAAMGQKKDSKGFESWDRNQNGYLEISEIPKNLRPQMRNWAVKLDLDPEKPLPLKVLLKSKGAGKPAKLTADEKAALKKERKKSREVKAAENENDEGQKQVRRVAGFGKDAAPETALAVSVSNPTAASSEKDKEKDKESAAERRKKRHFSMLARSLLFQNDKNKNGRLERNEWIALKGNPGLSDVNKDGVLSTEELALHLQGYGRRERDVTRRPTTREKRAQKNKDGKSYRFLTPHERLPDGLPGWFTEKDLNLDGQISLREFEANLTQDRVAKFRQLDLNRDGFIVAREYLRATETNQ